jgi:hypothetical protein
MKLLKRISKVFVFVLMLTIVAPAILPIGNAAVVQAATVKLTKKTLSLEVGESYTLKITGTESSVTWKSSDKSIATVNKKGKVSAVEVGTATITATVNKKKFTCKVTVTAKENPLVTNAPFGAQLVTYGAFTSVIPEDWESKIYAQDGNNIVAYMYPKNADPNVSISNVTLTIQETGIAKPDYSLVKMTFEQKITEELIISQLAQGGIDATLSDFKTSDYEATLGTAFKIDYTAHYLEGTEEKTFTQTIYDIYVDGYLIQVTVTDYADGVTPNVAEVGEYVLNSMEAQ